MHLRLVHHGLDLSKEQVVVLKKLHDHEGEGLNQNELAFLTNRDKSSLARLLSKMEKKKCIKRIQQFEDKRINHVILTDEGKRVYKKAKRALKELIEAMEMGISEEEKKHLIKILKKVQFNYKQESQVQ
ncbi:MarR family winged helix-turn-helix transcriptional regulator [Maribacter polysaccharolyticus]|uniref:MarR family winged helix-turn-helix transcriptional regulator n=1 Tax=Maribacter polysaccharolyticus TaxID=3020831 RepID=UPI00237FB1B8|nr:MarR family transcriptional regulator [Maribacter polysaccharolyticus]MDE3742839.1 MarR family transcriptional regulator [Maribacter polysaccharolyticus]